MFCHKIGAISDKIVLRASSFRRGHGLEETTSFTDVAASSMQLDSNCGYIDVVFKVINLSDRLLIL